MKTKTSLSEFNVQCKFSSQNACLLRSSSYCFTGALYAQGFNSHLRRAGKIFFMWLFHIAASCISLAAISVIKSERAHAAAPPSRKKSRSVHLLGCGGFQSRLRPSQRFAIATNLLRFAPCGAGDSFCLTLTKEKLLYFVRYSGFLLFYAYMSCCFHDRALLLFPVKIIDIMFVDRIANIL